MAVAFPIGVGLALVLGVIANYLATPLGNPVAAVSRCRECGHSPSSWMPWPTGGCLPQGQKTTGKGIAISVVAGVLMGFFYRFVAASMSSDFAHPEAGKMGPIFRGCRLLGRPLPLQFPVEQHRHGPALRRESRAVLFLPPRRQRTSPPCRHPGRDNLESWHVVQHPRLGGGRICDLLWTRPGSDHGRRALGRLLSGGNSSRLLPEPAACSR